MENVCASRDRTDRDQRIFYLQVRVSKRLKKRIADLAADNRRTVADIIRGALYFGVPILEQVLNMESKLTSLLMKGLDSTAFRRGRPLKKIFDKYH